MLSAEQQSELKMRGLTFVRAAVAPADAAEMERRIWVFLKKRGIDRDDRSTWPHGGLMSHVQGLRQAKVFAPFSNARMFAIVDQLLGAQTWSRWRQEGQALLSFPDEGAWHVPHRIWHFDMPARGPTDRFDAIRVFGYAATVAPRGGATLMVEGSPELVRRMIERSPKRDAGGSADVRRRLIAQSPWFRALTSPDGDRIKPFMEDGDEIDGVRVRVIEATGAAGDVCLMHPWTMHNTAKNCSDRPRMMMTQTYARDDNAFYGSGVERERAGAKE